MLVVMLISAGTAYAYWYDSLTISGDVTTANFDVELSLPQHWYYDCEWKDVVTEADVYFDWDTVFGDDVTITVNGAYPGYHGAILIGVISRGTVPAHMKGDPIINTVPDVPEFNVWLDDWSIGDTMDDICQGPYYDPFPDCWQLHELEYFFYIHFEVIEDDAAGILPQQGATYTFTVTLPLIQYNYDADCFNP